MENDDQMKQELDFLARMQDFRRARESSDPDALRKAEDALREQVRRELMGNDNCER